MNIHLCPTGLKSKRLRVSLICSIIKGVTAQNTDINCISHEISKRFGFPAEFEAKYSGKKHLTPSKSKSPETRSPGDRRARYYRHSKTRKWVPKPNGNLSGQGKDDLDWAFIHKEGEKPYSEQLPTRKSVSVFIRNAHDPCIPCTFLCPGCGKGSVQATISGMSPYGIDSEVICESAITCLESCLQGPTKIEYAKRGIIWTGHIPANVLHFSGPWQNIAILDHLHKNSEILSEFSYSPKT